MIIYNVKTQDAGTEQREGARSDQTQRRKQKPYSLAIHDWSFPELHRHGYVRYGTGTSRDLEGLMSKALEELLRSIRGSDGESCRQFACKRPKLLLAVLIVA